MDISISEPLASAHPQLIALLNTHIAQQEARDLLRVGVTPSHFQGCKTVHIARLQGRDDPALSILILWLTDQELIEIGDDLKAFIHNFVTSNHQNCLKLFVYGYDTLPAFPRDSEGRDKMDRTLSYLTCVHRLHEVFLEDLSFAAKTIYTTGADNGNGPILEMVTDRQGVYFRALCQITSFTIPDVRAVGHVFPTMESLLKGLHDPEERAGRWGMSDDVKYPLAVASGLSGNKAKMRDENNRRIRKALLAISPPPPWNRRFTPHHLNHRVTGPLMRTSHPSNAGSWYQRCNPEKTLFCRSFELAPGPGPDHAQQEPFVSLYTVRDELRKTPRPARRSSSLPAEEFHSSPLLGPVASSSDQTPLTSSPSSSVIDLTLEDEDDDQNDPAKEEDITSLWVQFYMQNCNVRLLLPAKDGVVHLSVNKVLLGSHRVEKRPMEVFCPRMRRWVPLDWSGGLLGPSDGVVEVCEKSFRPSEKTRVEMARQL
ncbi:hypothetical protein V5O48_016360 [Marasmius crinis-equi]|uniref:Uncharacterized protein n=1 Tax=Marasmius crinis-equi TaxID=585013 RepID=A0ABR3ERX4_9AGAR